MDGARTIDARRTTDVTPRVRSLNLVDSKVPRCVWVRDISAALDFYLAVDCVVLQAADGWVRLRNVNSSFILAQGSDPLGPLLPVIPELITAYLRAVCRRLRILGVPTEPIAPYPAAAGSKITVRDPGQHTVVVIEADVTASTSALEPVSSSVPARLDGDRRTTT